MKPEIQELLARVDADLARHAAAMGRKGGKAKSERKTAAARENAKKPRPRKTFVSADGNWKMTYIGKDKP